MNETTTMDAETRRIYIACLETAKKDAENECLDIFDVDDMTRIFDRLKEGEMLKDIYEIGSNGIIDRVLEHEGLISEGEWL